MNLEMVAVLLLALLIFAATVAALMFYVRHWATREAQQVPSAQLTEGRFLKRYIPPPLRPAYDKKQGSRTNRKAIRRRTVARLLNFAIVVVALGVAGGALDVNRFKLLPRIDLTPEEVRSLQIVNSSWSPVTTHGLPSMKQQVALLRQRGIAVVASKSDEGLVLQGQRITVMAEEHWRNFFNRWKIPYRLCDWQGLATCLGERIGIVLPGTWQLEELDHAMEDGANLLLYGPPSSVLTGHRPFEWHGLTFKPYSNGTGRHMALVGDQLLTLGFDAGLILAADRAFKGYRVFSDSPQAIGISADREAGGAVDTRIFSKGIGKGRLVWMDYAPDEVDQLAEINVRNLDAVNAAVFRYLLGQSYSGWAMWPQGKRFAGMISEDSEDKFHYAERVIDLVTTHGFPITWFMLSNEALRHRSLTRRMAEVGEVACHGDSHDPFPLVDLQTQTERLARCAKVVKTITGIPPRGFRPPEEKYNGDTINAVASRNMSYYFADAGIDRLVPVLMQENGGSRELVSLPRMGADDYQMWHALKLDGKESLRRAESELKWVSTVGGFLPFDFHTQYMDKKEHLAVVEYYGLRFKQPDCFFATAGQIADWWRVRTDLINGKQVTNAVLAKYQPVRIRVDAQGQLTRDQPESL